MRPLTSVLDRQTTLALPVGDHHAATVVEKGEPVGIPTLLHRLAKG